MIGTRDWYVQRISQPLVDSLGDHEERAAHGIKDPVVGRAAQAQALARDLAPGQIGHFAAVDPHRAIDVQIAGLFGIVAHPALAELVHPGGRVARFVH